MKVILYNFKATKRLYESETPKSFHMNMLLFKHNDFAVNLLIPLMQIYCLREMDWFN